MSEIIIAVIAILTPIILSTVGFFYIKNKIKNEASTMILDIIDDILPELPKLLAKEEVRQFIYSLGVLAGNGAKAGALGNVGKGKFKFEDLLGSLVGQFAPKIIETALNSTGNVGSTGNSGGVSDKW